MDCLFHMNLLEHSTKTLVELYNIFYDLKMKKNFQKYKDDIITKELIKIEKILNGHLIYYIQN